MYVGHNIMREKCKVGVFHVPSEEVEGQRQKHEENPKPSG
jgi:hypothetical protein